MLFTDADVFTVPNPDPNYHYVWAPADPAALSEYLMSGYQLCLGDEEAKKLFGDEAGSVLVGPDGRLRKGDTVLIKCTMKRYEEIQRWVEERNREAKEGPMSHLRQQVEALGVKGIEPFEVPIEEYVDRKEFDTRESKNRVGYTGKGGK